MSSRNTVVFGISASRVSMCRWKLEYSRATADPIDQSCGSEEAFVLFFYFILSVSVYFIVAMVSGNF